MGIASNILIKKLSVKIDDMDRTCFLITQNILDILFGLYKVLRLDN